MCPIDFDTTPDYLHPDTRNVIDEFKGLPTEEIKRRINRHHFSIACFNVERSLHIGTIIRLSNSFAAARFIYIGRRKFNIASSVGTHHFENMVHCADVSDFFKFCERENLTPIAIDYIPGRSIDIIEVPKYPENPVLIFGSEASGLSNEMLERCKFHYHIGMFGSVRSFSVGQAAAIMCFDWRMKHLPK